MGERQSRWSRKAGGFAVCVFRVTLARYFGICKRRWVDTFGPPSIPRGLQWFLLNSKARRTSREPLSFARFAHTLWQLLTKVTNRPAILRLNSDIILRLLVSESNSPRALKTPPVNSLRNRHRRAFPRRCPSPQSRRPIPRMTKGKGSGARALTSRSSALYRRTRNRTVRTEHTTIARLWFQASAALFAVIEQLAGIGRHQFFGGASAVWAGDNRDQSHKRGPRYQGGGKRRSVTARGNERAARLPS
jgi:hypothetical protein